MFVELGMGNMPTNPKVLYPELVRQFMATVNVYYAKERAKRANEGILTFFIRGIHYRGPLSALSIIYRFQNAELQHAIIPGFAGRSHFWEHIATGIFDCGSALQMDICHPTQCYFMKVLANTLLCKMEPSKVRVQELTLVYNAEASLASSFTPTRTFSALHRPCRAATPCNDLEDISRGSQRRRSVRASSPSAAGPSRQRKGGSEETTDETTDED
ncbi:hypothetical protein F2Q68_00016132 [Brassica cretica]|uniref:Arabidopsis retrotransposon Orf1 C-terminal domain-containing protein n=1 Tax=Brassica cretica TaxID=69181 RepID=A0A8S9HMJ2_BRACR|nr:hypothetical protein F2Q68_00016132 [Brassica cretica]